MKLLPYAKAVTGMIALATVTLVSAQASPNTLTIDLDRQTSSVTVIDLAPKPISPGMALEMAATLRNTSGGRLESLTLDPKALNEATGALTLMAERCSEPWEPHDRSGTGPAFTCPGDTSVALSPRPMASGPGALTGLAVHSPDGVDYLRVTLQAPLQSAGDQVAEARLTLLTHPS